MEYTVYTLYTLYTMYTVYTITTLHAVSMMINKVYKYKYCNVNRNSILYYIVSKYHSIFIIMDYLPNRLSHRHLNRFHCRYHVSSQVYVVSSSLLNYRLYVLSPFLQISPHLRCPIYQVVPIPIHIYTHSNVYILIIILTIS